MHIRVQGAGCAGSVAGTQDYESVGVVARVGSDGDSALAGGGAEAAAGACRAGEVESGQRAGGAGSGLRGQRERAVIRRERLLVPAEFVQRASPVLPDIGGGGGKASRLVVRRKGLLVRAEPAQALRQQ